MPRLTQDVFQGRDHEVEFPHWKCPRCGTVMFWIGATSHKNRCRA
jgi:ribosomal protein S27AE